MTGLPSPPLGKEGGGDVPTGGFVLLGGLFGLGDGEVGSAGVGLGDGEVGSAGVGFGVGADGDGSVGAGVESAGGV
jgi:hypothetical protein